MNEQQEQWLTGFWEGDGYLGVTNRDYLLISFGQKERDILDYAGSLIGTGHFYQNSETSYEENRDDILEYQRRRWLERKKVQEYMKAHPEEVEKLRCKLQENT